MSFAKRKLPFRGVGAVFAEQNLCIECKESHRTLHEKFIFHEIISEIPEFVDSGRKNFIIYCTKYILEVITMPKVFIDQGHNPQNPNAGAEGNGLREQDITYEIGTILAALLNSNPDFEARVSRNSPTEQIGTSTSSSLAERVREANDWGADIFLSLHTNAYTNPGASGVESFSYRVDSNGFRLAEDVADQLSLITGLQNRGTFARPSLYVLRRTRMPAALIEMGYITNPTDAALMSEQPDLFALGIYNGIMEYFGM